MNNAWQTLSVQNTCQTAGVWAISWNALEKEKDNVAEDQVITAQVVQVTDKEFWQLIRRAIIMILKAIEKKYLDKTE